ncbi:MAG: hypothetical protein NT154_17770, partial [Verrucomicrobia bacterium]|nr:hypothetical protein [Verrucomicrobiota bacterium]
AYAGGVQAPKDIGRDLDVANQDAFGNFQAEGADGKIQVIGKWKGGRTGTFREAETYGGIAHGEKGDAPVGAYDGYAPLVAEIVKFFQTRQSPVPAAESIEIFAFMEAADASKRQGGKPVALREVLEKAKAKPL